MNQENKELSYKDFTNLDNESVHISSLVYELMQKTQTYDEHFFTVLVCHYFGMIGALQHMTIKGKTRGKLPIGNYAIMLAPSGFGKGYSQHLVENEVMKLFMDEFKHKTFNESFEDRIVNVAQTIAVKKKADPEYIERALRNDFERAGTFVPTFDSATKAAIRQQREKIALAGVGSLNFIMDELGSNFLGAEEEQAAFLELYDTGSLKQKLIKNTKENQRSSGVDGMTPATMLLFGSDSKLFDGAKTEQAFMDALLVGYARRCLFATGSLESKSVNRILSLQERYQRLLNASNSALWNSFADRCLQFADSSWTRKVIHIDEPEEMLLLNYQLACEEEAKRLNEFAELERIELIHRHSKVLKLAGCIAMISMENTVSENSLLSAIAIVEASGKSFNKIIKRERPYATLARYLASKDEVVTLAELSEDLPFFKTGYALRREMLDMASAWGVRNFISIKKDIMEGIEVYSAESLNKIDLNDPLYISMSTTMSSGFVPTEFRWDKIKEILTMDSMTFNGTGDETCPASFAVHTFKDDKRCIANVNKGFSFIVLDIDGTAKLESVHDVLKDITFATCTTKSHTEASHRFRVVIPMNVSLNLDESQYSQFMANILDYLPFDSDKASKDIARKWSTNPYGQVHVNNTETLFDVFPFIPNTRKCEVHKNTVLVQRKDISNHSRLVVWFINQMNQKGERNNHLFRLGVMLLESGQTINAVAQLLFDTNERLDNPLDKDEVDTLIRSSLKPRYLALKQERAVINEDANTQQQQPIEDSI